MKKLFLLMFVAVVASSCGTLFNGGKATAYQTTKPSPGEQSRKIKAGALIADILLFPPALILDFANGTIYKKSK